VTHTPGRAAPPLTRPDPSGAESDAPFGFCGSRLWLCGAERRVVVFPFLFRSLFCRTLGVERYFVA